MIAANMFEGWSCDMKISLMVTVACWGQLDCHKDA